jgi:hypothetical protein
MYSERGKIISAGEFIARRGVFSGDVSQRISQPNESEPTDLEGNISSFSLQNNSSKEKRKKEIALIRILLRSPRYQMFDKNVWRYLRYNWNKT